jgi:TRAP-type C4-dicarboxylate transport system permease small subunit
MQHFDLQCLLVKKDDIRLRGEKMKKRKLLVHALILVAIFLIAFGPLIISLSAGAFASINSCTLHEGFSNPCVVFGIDFGENLYSLGVMGWYTLVTFPTAMFLFALYILIVFISWLRNRKKEIS